MTVRSFAWTVATSGRWVGLALLLTIGAALLAAAAEMAQGAFGLADLACAPCVDPGNGIDTAAAAAGAAAAGAAAGGAAAGGGDAGGSSRDPNPRFSDPHTNPRLPGPEDDVGDATSPHQQLEIARDGATGRPGGPMLGMSRQLQRWAEYWTGTDIIGTVPAGGRA